MTTDHQPLPSTEDHLCGSRVVVLRRGLYLSTGCAGSGSNPLSCSGDSWRSMTGTCHGEGVLWPCRGRATEKGQWPLPTFLSAALTLIPDTRFSLYATGTFQAATLVLELRGSEFE